MNTHVSPIGVGLIGFGTVGQAVARTLLDESDRISRISGTPYELLAIGVRSLETPRPSFARNLLTTDVVNEIIRNERIGLIIELAGPADVIHNYITDSLRLGKHIVTANKAILARYGTQLFKLAAESAAQLRFEASVAGAIPVIRLVREAFAGEEIESVYGIVNGTCNYILSRMEDGKDYKSALRTAQKLGYAEDPPTIDVEGHDAHQKTLILSSLLSSVAVPDVSVYREGIVGITQEDIRFTRERGYVIRLVATIKRGRGWLEARVHPVLLPKDHPLAAVRGAFNAIYLVGRLSGPTMHLGAGAGGNETASAVLGDFVDILRDLGLGNKARLGVPWDMVQPLDFRTIDESKFGYYLRLRIPSPDRRNSFAKAVSVLNDYGCSAHIIEQRPVNWGIGSAYLMTQPRARVKERRFREALEEIRDSCDASIGTWVRIDPDIKVPR